ncbi:MAG TPA: hypothetical protein VHI54_01080 [Actinomycetota bacterium]|nr:hypothetical protein [Actinomycetota bacterium]
MRIASFIVAALFVLLGIRSLIRWFRTHFQAASGTEQFLYSLHVTARVGIWFALGAAFLGYAVVDEPQEFTWFVAVPVVLAAAQLLTSMLLARSPSGSDNRPEGD